MDITHRFKAGIITVKVKQKSNQGKQHILPKSTNGSNANGLRNEFSKQAKDVCQQITALRNVLIENRGAYMHIGQYIKSSAHITDEQRDLIDRETEQFVIRYTQHLALIRNDWKKSKRKVQQTEHTEAVLDMLCAYLKSVQQMHSDMKKYRVQYELETYRFSKLIYDKKLIPVKPGGEVKSKKMSIIEDKLNQKYQCDHNSDSLCLNEGWEIDDIDITAPILNSNDEYNNLNGKDKSNNLLIKSEMHTKNQIALNEEQENLLDTDNMIEKQLSPEEIQMLEEENLQLYHELQGVNEDIETIEKNVVDIANLQDVFTEKVTLQQHNIERIVNAVIGSTENVKDANEQIKQAIQRNAGLRIWILFYMLVMSFALLFLDWYYD